MQVLRALCLARARARAVLGYWRLLLVGLLTVPLAAAARADEPDPGLRSPVPVLHPAPELGAVIGKPLTRVRVLVQGQHWRANAPAPRAEVGQLLSPELVRRSLDELLDTGRFADARAEVIADGEGVALDLVVTPRRVVVDVRVSGGALDEELLLRTAGATPGRELTEADLTRIERRLREEYARRGFPSVETEVRAIDTDDPRSVALRIEVEPGPPERLAKLSFETQPNPPEAGLLPALRGYEVEVGARSDLDAIKSADRALETRLRARGFYQATVASRLDHPPSGPALVVSVNAGERTVVGFEGNRLFDDDELAAVLGLEDSEDRAPDTLAEKLRKFYVEHGRLDVDVRIALRPARGARRVELAFIIHEGDALRVRRRIYPCLTEVKPRAVSAEIDSFLAELPGGELVGPAAPRSTDPAFAGGAARGVRPPERSFSPFNYYVPEVYERAVEHLRDLYHSEGYLSASVGPVQLLRQACDRRSAPGACWARDVVPAPEAPCTHDRVGVPLEEPALPASYRCQPDLKKGLHCAADATVRLPIKLGPRTYLYDVAFEGNRALVESELFRSSALELGVPLSQAELDRARRRVLDAYAEEGFAFAEAETELDLSPDHTRGRARFVISERERVRVSRIVVRGARLTSERLIRSRIALQSGGIYRRSLLRRTEERLATLGVFGSVSVGFEDPYVPAREKVVVVTVEERLAQYLDVRPGISSGEGFRISFEYGHRNLGGEAVQLTLRSQLNFLPKEFIFESDVRKKHDAFSTRFGRHNSASVEFPEVGLGPLFRLNVEGVDVRDNARDYGLTKDAGILTLIYRPERRFSVQLGGSLELNNAEIFGSAEVAGALSDYIEQHGQLNTFRVPEGTTFVVAERVSATLDQRDVPLDATSGYLLSGSVEHVRAKPLDEETVQLGDGKINPFAAVTSDFMRYSARVAGYLRLSERGTSLAVSFRSGIIHPTSSTRDSPTYPDRLFFLGGVESIRGFLQDSLIPEDIARQLLDGQARLREDPDDDSALTVNQVVIRGGNFFVNPRLELRLPVTSSLQTALFLDAGNLWTRPSAFSLTDLRLRYAFGTGVRFATPVGPLVFDYGFNLDRVLDKIDRNRTRQRFWEDLGAFHFSIGLF